jgi:Pentapeptide repeats (8 copies)
MLKRWTAWPRGIRWLIGGISAVVLALAITWVLFVPIADWLAHHDVGSARGPLLQTARDAARGRLLTLAAGLFAVGALVYTARNYSLSREGQVTDRYTKAIEQLGSKELDVRIGGIYALERIARDSARDHPTVMEVLTAFIREHSHEQWPPPDLGGSEQERSTRPDVQAAVTVVGRRDAERDIQPIDLTGATLTRATLTGASLAAAHLAAADLVGADLRRAYLDAADLTGANLVGANLALASFAETSPFGGEVRRHAGLFGLIVHFRANLTDADLTGADLTGTIFGGARLDGARWPQDAKVPQGWKLDTSSGRLEAAGTDPEPAKGN